MKTKSGHEKEVKFLISDIQEIIQRLQTAGAVCSKTRIHEKNLRFDNPNKDLRVQKHVLRLRRDTQNILTFKGSANYQDGIADRQEIEVTTSNFEDTKNILEALGFQVFMIYEKYRTTYTLKDCEVVLDEMPFGTFIEIEGTSATAIQSISQMLELDWSERITVSYLELFRRVKTNRSLQFENLSFSEMEGHHFNKEDFAPTKSP